MTKKGTAQKTQGSVNAVVGMIRRPFIFAFPPVSASCADGHFPVVQILGCAEPVPLVKAEDEEPKLPENAAHGPAPPFWVLKTDF